MSMRDLAGLLTIGVLTATAVTGCSDGDDDGSPIDSALGLPAALQRVSPPDGDRVSIYYQNTRALDELLGGDFTLNQDPPNYPLLNGMGAVSLSSMVIPAVDDVGIVLSESDFAVTVGEPPAQYALISGGQDGDTVSGKLTDAGWTADGDRLVAPQSLDAVDQAFANYAIALAQVEADGTDLRYGGAEADLSNIDGSDSLADDDRVAAVADCLGDVLVAMIDTPELRETTPMVGVGVRAESVDDRPEAVVCVSWDSEEQASAYADRATTALSGGASIATGQPYSELYELSGEVEVDGTLTSWRALTRISNTVIQGMFRGELPGMLLSCDMLPPEQLEQVEQYC